MKSLEAEKFIVHTERKGGGPGQSKHPQGETRAREETTVKVVVQAGQKVIVDRFR